MRGGDVLTTPGILVAARDLPAKATNAILDKAARENLLVQVAPAGHQDQNRAANEEKNIPRSRAIQSSEVVILTTTTAGILVAGRDSPNKVTNAISGRAARENHLVLVAVAGHQDQNKATNAEKNILRSRAHQDSDVVILTTTTAGILTAARDLPAKATNAISGRAARENHLVLVVAGHQDQNKATNEENNILRSHAHQSSGVALLKTGMTVAAEKNQSLFRENALPETGRPLTRLKKLLHKPKKSA